MGDRGVSQNIGGTSSDRGRLATMIARRQRVELVKDDEHAEGASVLCTVLNEVV